MKLHWLATGALVVSLLVFASGGCTRDPLVRQGRSLFVYYCSHCHGDGGGGDGFNADYLDPLPRDLTDSEEEYLAGLTHEEIYEVIEHGGKGIDITPLMPVFGHTFSEEEIWSLVAYVRTLHPNEAPKVVLPEDVKTTRPRAAPVRRGEFQQVAQAFQEEEMVEEGQRLFEEEYGCDGCHRVGDWGGRVGPDLSRAGFRLQPDYIYRWVKNPQAIKPRTKMPNFNMSDRDAVAITRYLGVLRQAAPGPPGAEPPAS